MSDHLEMCGFELYILISLINSPQTYYGHFLQYILLCSPLIDFSFLKFIYYALSAWLQWLFSLSQLVTAALHARGDILIMFRHHWKSWSVCLSLWPQHKQLHPQINKTWGGPKVQQDVVQEALRQLIRAASVFVLVFICVKVCMRMISCVTGIECLVVEECRVVSYCSFYIISVRLFMFYSQR